MEPGHPLQLDRNFWMWHAAAPLLAFSFLAAFCEITHIDLILSDCFYDFRQGCWPARNSFWAEWLIHKRGRDLVVIVASASFLCWLGSLRFSVLRKWRRSALLVLLAIAIGTSLVTLGKDLSNRNCPWDMDRYGGSVPYTTLFEGTPAGQARGRCFPAGHAAGGFSLMALYFAFRDRSDKVALALLMAGFLLGCVFGVGQMARGAHFFSHNVWSAAVCWFTALALYFVLCRDSTALEAAVTPYSESCERAYNNT